MYVAPVTLAGTVGAAGGTDALGVGAGRCLGRRVVWMEMGVPGGGGIRSLAATAGRLWPGGSTYTGCPPTVWPGSSGLCGGLR